MKAPCKNKSVEEVHLQQVHSTRAHPASNANATATRITTYPKENHAFWTDEMTRWIWQVNEGHSKHISIKWNKPSFWLTKSHFTVKIHSPVQTTLEVKCEKRASRTRKSIGKFFHLYSDLFLSFHVSN